MLVVVLEGSKAAYLKRRDAWCEARGVDVEELKKWCTVARPPRVHLVNLDVWTDAEGNEHNRVVHVPGMSKSVYDIVRLIKKERPGLVIIDNLASGVDDPTNMRGADLGQILDNMQAMTNGGATTVLMVAHTNAQDTKTTEFIGYEDRMDTMFHTRKVREGEHTVVVRKHRDAGESPLLGFGVKPFGESVAVVPAFGAGAAIVAAMRELGQREGKNEILKKARAMGAKIQRTAGLALISELAKDPESPVYEKDGKFGVEPTSGTSFSEEP